MLLINIIIDLDDNDAFIAFGSVDSNDQESSFSNYGSCVDLWAPSHTLAIMPYYKLRLLMPSASSAAAYGAGAAALYLSHNPTASPAQVEGALKNYSLWKSSLSKDGRNVRLLQEAGL